VSTMLETAPKSRRRKWPRQAGAASLFAEQFNTISWIYK